tara:strand:- start:162 stop:443 length:282 start_codon:yes stop_codon:yes gene_type:complete
MNKTAKIIISILVVLCVFLILMVRIKGNEAEKLAAITIDLKEEAMELSEMSKRQAADAIEAQNKAEENAAQAKLAQKEAERVMVELQKCKSGK